MPRHGEMLASFSLEGEASLARLDSPMELQPGRLYGVTVEVKRCEVWPAGEGGGTRSA